jgi:hypothetical protein
MFAAISTVGAKPLSGPLPPEKDTSTAIKVSKNKTARMMGKGKTLPCRRKGRTIVEMQWWQQDEMNDV